MAREFAEENAGPTVPALDTANDRIQTSNPQSDGDEAGSGHESDDTEEEDTEQNHAEEEAPETDPSNSCVEEVQPEVDDEDVEAARIAEAAAKANETAK